MVALGGVVGFEGGLGGTALPGVVSAVLAGSIFGDHCSPISDTTVLSSMSAACDHMDHVRTQMPYAVPVAGLALLFGHLATAYGTPIWIAYGLSMLILAGSVRFIGKPVSGF